MAMKIFAGCMVVSMLALIAFATIRRPPTSVARTTGFPALELGILSEDGQGLVPDADNLSAQDIAAVSLVSTDDGMPEVAIQFTPSGGRKIERLSSSHFGKRLAFLINGKIDTSQAGVITGPLSESVSMSFPSQEEARRFVDGMNK
jgi:preprotein translocase subunit SecD